MLKHFRNLLVLDSKNTLNYLTKNQLCLTSFIRNDQRGTTEKQNIKETIDDMVKKNQVVVFMKGTPNAPRCGFSKSAIQILNFYKVKYDAYNVLDSEELRSGIKEYSNWPTIPQVFLKGEFIGGYDILADMHQTGELKKELEKLGIKSNDSENAGSKP